ncbi:MFS transporter [Pseudonocardia acaciae]|uniref:MFS transporter n=1 Tax=Pseudonocardia acaciae TaxID=551276 RepID=UPI0004904779|nr:MFS transporter [Pseudonocardia acaciae]
MRKSWIALLVALGIDNFGSGLFLPLTLVFVTRVVGLPLAVAGTAVTVGTVAGLAAPPLAGRLVDRLGARAVVVIAQLLQAGGAAAYLAADGVALVVTAAVLFASGQQAFYSALFALIADVAGDGPKDRAFTVANMVRGATFGFGALVVAGLLTGAGPVGYRVAIGVDAVSFLVAAALLAFWLRVPPPVPPRPSAAAPVRGVLRDRPYLGLIAITTMFALASDFFLVGVPVYALEILHAPPWLPGAILALLTVITSTAGTVVLRATGRLSRPAAIGLAAAIVAVWCAASAAALLLPAGVRPPYLVACTLIVAAATLVSSGRANALAEAAAPREARGRYLAAFQYAFTVAGVIAPGVVALFSVAAWLPWLLVAAAALLSAGLLRWVAPRLPAHAVMTPA